MVPFRDFILTANGMTQKHQFQFEKENVKSIGFSCMRQTGPFGIEIEWIKAMNTMDTFGEFDIPLKRIGKAELLKEHLEKVKKNFRWF